jgi:hypothetical protein
MGHSSTDKALVGTMTALRIDERESLTFEHPFPAKRGIKARQVSQICEAELHCARRGKLPDVDEIAVKRSSDGKAGVMSASYDPN